MINRPKSNTLLGFGVLMGHSTQNGDNIQVRNYEIIIITLQMFWENL